MKNKVEPAKVVFVVIYSRMCHILGDNFTNDVLIKMQEAFVGHFVHALYDYMEQGGTGKSPFFHKMYVSNFGREFYNCHSTIKGYVKGGV